MTSKSAPDILVITLDAVRSQDVYSNREGDISDLPFLSKLGGESAVFPQSISAGAWTLPSVASLVTGLYPWEHGVSALGGSYLDPSTPTLASCLRAKGYLTVLLSANNVVGPRTNLSTGFETTYIADWWEQYLRLRRAHPGGMGATVGESPSGAAGGTLGQLRRRGARKAMRLGFRHPGFLERANELVQRLMDPANPVNLHVAPWIEPTFHRVLCDVPRSRPLFCLVHFNDAHEPYFRPSRGRGTASSGASAPAVRQDYMRFIEGDWSPSSRELATLHGLYRTTIHELDRRIETLIATFSKFRDLDQTLLLITADHGQAFGDSGWLFHMSNEGESLLRVPLIVRFPGRSPRGRGNGWASTVDVVPTVFEAIDLPGSERMAGVPLQRLMSEPRVTPVWALGDGLPLHHLEGIVSLPPDRKLAIAERTWLAAYQGSSKMVYDLRSGTFEVLQVDTSEESDQQVSNHNSNLILRNRAEAARLAELVLGQRKRNARDSVAERLDSWGYGV